MKKLLILMAMLLVAAGAGAFPFDKYTIDRSELPQEAVTFLDKHFPKAKIGMIKVDKHLLKKPDYDVRLTNGTTIEFRSNGKWKEVDCKTRAVPDAIIPSAIRRHLSKNYPGVFVTQIKKDSKGFELELSDDIELKYDLLGTFKSAKMDN